MHALLVAAALLVGSPWAFKLVALAALAVHFVIRRPRPTPRSIVVGADATCSVAEWAVSRAALGPRTVVCGYWVRLALELGISPAPRDIVLFIDQVGAEQWAQLRALLERARCDTPHVSRRLREPN